MVMNGYSMVTRVKKGKRIRRLALVVAAVMLLTGCSKTEEIPVLNDSVRACRDEAIVQEGDLKDISWYELTAVAPTYEVTSEREAYLVSWNKTLGDSVKAGDVIASIEYQSIENTDAGQTQSEKHSELEYAELDLEIAEAKLEALKESGADENAVELARIDKELAKLSYEKLLRAYGKYNEGSEALANGGNKTDETQTDETQTEAAEVLETEAKTEAEAETFETTAEATAETFEAATETAVEAEAVTESVPNAGIFELKAPTDGIITYRSLQMPGDRINARSVVATVTNEQVELQGSFISERTLNAIERVYAYINGQECELTKLPYSTSDYANKVARFTSPVLPGVGESVGAFIVSGTILGAIFVPVDALRADRDGYYLYMVDGSGNKERRAVEIGRITTSYVQLLSGAEAGERVLVSDTAREVDASLGSSAYRGTFSDEQNFKATVTCLESAKLYFNREDNIFDKFLVKEGDYVKAGTVIAVCKADISEDEIPQLLHETERIGQNLERRRIAHESEIAILKEREASAKGAEKKVYGLRIEKAVMEFSDYSEEAQNQIASLKDKIAICENRELAAQVVAPIDCHIDKLAYLRSDDQVGTGRWIAMIHADNSEYLQVTDKKETLNGLMKVTVQANGKEYYDGTVVQADNLLNGAVKTGKAYVLLDDRSVKLSELKNPVVIARKPVVEGTVIVPRTAVSTAKGKKYVLVVGDGVAQKRYVTVGPNNNDEICILSGLFEGEKVLKQ